MPSLLCLIYVSSAHRRLREPELESLLSVSRARNLEDGLTGVLLYNDGNFMQYLEGPDTALRQTYKRICADPLHGNLIEILLEPITERSFATWAMGFTQPTTSELLALSNARWKRMGIDTTIPEEASPGMLLLHSFWRAAQR